ncbi:MAG: hypothetical protein ACOC4J_01915 [Bacteroidota bacterium]
MTRLTENTIEEFTIKLLEHNGYEYIYAPNIAHAMQPKLLKSEIKILNQ